MAATSVSLSYNGFSSFKNVRITRFEHVPDTSPERAGRGVTRHIMEGDAIVQFSGSGSESIQTKMATLAASLNRQGRTLTLTTVDTGGASHAIVNVESDDKTGPYPTVRVTEIVGANNCALVQFAFEWYRTYQSGSDLSIVREFVCVCNFDIDAVGNTTMTLNGHITLVKSSASTPTSVEGAPPTSAKPSVSGTYPYGYASTWSRKDAVPDWPYTDAGTDPTSAFPEQYRRLVAGNLYPGFRRVAQQYATDESRTRMVFRVVHQEFSRGLPAPCRIADINYTYERAIAGGDGDMSMLGRKTFSCTAIGPSNVSPTDLLILAMRLSQQRIYWSRTALAGSGDLVGPDIIRRIMVSEVDMANQNAIHFEVEAAGTADITAGTSASGTTDVQTGKPHLTPGLLSDILGTLSVTPINYDAGETDGTLVTFTFAAAKQPDAYGNFGVYRIVPSWYDPELAQASKNWDTTQVLKSADKAEAVYIFPDAVFDSHYSAAFVSDSQAVPLGKDNAKTRKDDAASRNGDGAPYLHVAAIERRTTDTGLVHCPSQSPTGSDLLFQIRKPMVVVHQRATMIRLNKSPSREFLTRDPNSMVVYEDFVTHAGKSDAVNNRMMGATHERIYVVYDDGSASGTTFYTNGDYRQAWPNNLGDNSNLTTGDSQAQGDVQIPKLATRDPKDGDPSFKFEFGSPEDWVT